MSISSKTYAHTSRELRNRGNILGNVMDRPRPQPRGWYVSRATCPRNLTEASGRLVSAALWRVRLASGPHRAALFLWVAHEYRMHWLDRLHIPRQCLTTPRKPAVLVFVSRRRANGGPCGPECTIDALAKAVIRIAPIFRKPRAAPVETTGVAPASPPAPQPSMTREQWKQSHRAGRKFCERSTNRLAA